MITKLIAFAINTGLVTSICALASLITVSFEPSLLLFDINRNDRSLHYPICSFTSRSISPSADYTAIPCSQRKSQLILATQSNFLFVSLNARRAIRGTSNEEYSMGSMSNRLAADTHKSFGNFVKSNTHNPATMSIKVDATQETDYDYVKDSPVRSHLEF
jgi:hypothetical protein